MKRFPKLKSAHFYHVFNRGVSKRKIFINEKDYRFFMFKIAAYKKQYSINIKKYCIMPTHFHLLLITNDDPNKISVFMKNLQMSYARYFNRTYVHSGHVFQSKFVNKAIEIIDLSILIRYIEQNPVRDGYVKNPEEWPYRG